MKEMITKTTNPAAVGRLLRAAADRLDEIRHALFPKQTKAADRRKGGDHAR